MATSNLNRLKEAKKQVEIVAESTDETGPFEEVMDLIDALIEELE